MMKGIARDRTLNEDVIEFMIDDTAVVLRPDATIISFKYIFFHVVRVKRFSRRRQRVRMSHRELR